jgi:protein-S-isoprenylcysteine O-methyltransferase Ste14
MIAGQLSRGELLRMVLPRFAGGMAGLAVLFFLPAGTLAYWHAWAWLATLIFPMVLVLNWSMKHDPALLERRMRTREKEGQQKLIMGLSYVWLLPTFLLPGLDYRFGWSAVPTWAVWVSDGLILLAYYLFFRVLRENSFASRVIEVERGQRVIDSGPYAVVRHPMYLAVLVIYGITPLALGSYWTLIPMLLIVPILVARIRNEEAVLAAQLPGYAAYMQKTPYRILPGVW